MRFFVLLTFSSLTLLGMSGGAFSFDDETISSSPLNSAQRNTQQNSKGKNHKSREQTSSSQREENKVTSLEEKENICPGVNSSFERGGLTQPKKSPRKKKSPSKALKKVKEMISQGYREANSLLLVKAYEAFEGLSYKSTQWEALGNRFHVYKWPSQTTWKEAVGGFLFFPQEAFEWEGTPGESYRLRRKDILQSFAIAAKFQNPLGQYYLVKVLNSIHSDYTTAKGSRFFESVYKEAFKTLKKCPDNSDACYILGVSYHDTTHPLLKYNERKALKWHTRGTDAKNQLQLLLLKTQQGDEAVCRRDYISLAETGYMRAYLEAAQNMEKTEEELSILVQASERGYLPALRWQGVVHENLSLYREEANRFSVPEEGSASLAKARELYEDAGTKGFPEAYIDLGKSYVGDMRDNSLSNKKRLDALSRKDIERARTAFKSAEALLHPEGSVCLGDLYLILNGKEQGLEEKKNAALCAYPAYKRGAQLGSPAAYHRIHRIFPQQFSELVKKYGPAPQEKLQENIQMFLLN